MGTPWFKLYVILFFLILAMSDIFSSDLNVTPEILKDVLGLLELMNTSSKNMPKAHSLFMDELSSMVKQTTLHPKVSVSTTVSFEFHSLYSRVVTN